MVRQLKERWAIPRRPSGSTEAGAFQDPIPFRCPTDPAATLPPNNAFNPHVDFGKPTFKNGVVLRTPGTKTITVVDANNGSILGSVTITVL